MNDCGNCRHTNHLALPDFSTMPCAACARYGADNDPTMWEAKPITNYDRIISKSPEELAMLLGAPSIVSPPWCEMNYDCPHIDEDPARCDLCALDWLKQEETE